MRVQKPMPLDFRDLAEAVRKNNMGLGGFRLEARAAVEEARVRIEPTGQLFRLSGVTPAERGPAWRAMRVTAWEDPEKTALEIVRSGFPGSS